MKGPDVSCVSNFFLYRHRKSTNNLVEDIFRQALFCVVKWYRYCSIFVYCLHLSDVC